MSAGSSDGGPVIVGPEQARRIARENRASIDAPITISFCNTGHWAAINWFALSELAGVEGVKLYPELVVDWSQAGCRWITCRDASNGCGCPPGSGSQQTFG